MLLEFQSITDLVVIPQAERAASHGQVPAKIFDAMAMPKPIIATNVSDIPEILDGCGWIVEPENPRQLAETIQYVFDHPAEAKQKGKRLARNVKENIGRLAGDCGQRTSGNRTISSRPYDSPSRRPRNASAQ